MLPDGSIAAEHIWKGFRADRAGGQLQGELYRLAAKLKGGGQKGWRWAVQDVDLKVEPGESVGLVGTNGSGKSTLLKILTQVMYPYAGRLEVQGRVGALIEVRAGIHPDLTGGENINLMGTLLGLSRRDIAARFNAIIEFAELENAIDRQVKFYSSGMQMRLGFSIAAFLEPDILLVDEVLAVGDASFQQRCLERMRYVLAQGTTLVFVSHDLAAVEAICRRAVWLDQGVARAAGPVRDVLQSYRQAVEERASLGASEGRLIHLIRADATGPEGDQPRTSEPLQIELHVKSQGANSGNLCIGASQGTATPIFMVRRNFSLAEGQTVIRCTIPHIPLPRGRYYLWATLWDVDGLDYLPWHPVASFDVFGPPLPHPRGGIMLLAPIYAASDWQFDHAP